MRGAFVAEAQGLEGYERYRAALDYESMPLDLECARPEEFRSEMSVSSVGDLTVTDMWISGGGPTRVLRGPRHIRRSDPQAYRLFLTITGCSDFEQNGRHLRLAPGDVALFDSSQPFAGRRETHQRSIMATFPRSLIALSRSTVTRATARTWPMDSVAARAVASLLSGFAGTAPQDARAAGNLSSAFLELVTAVLVQDLSPPGPVGPASSESLFAAVSAFVDDHLQDPDLDPALVAAAQHMSLRSLHRLFRDSGWTVSELIQSRRLDRARRDLRNPALAALPVSAIGARWGFGNAAHFSRTFSRAYHVPPGHYRDRHLRPASPGRPRGVTGTEPLTVTAGPPPRRRRPALPLQAGGDAERGTAGQDLGSQGQPAGPAGT